MSELQRQIAYISGTRADFGLMTPVLKAIDQSDKLSLQTYITSIHLLEQFGRSGQIVESMFPQTKIIDTVVETDDKAGMARFAGNFLSAVTEELIKNRPDLLLVLGDRTEMLCVAMAGGLLGIPVGHIHGGDRTAVDDVARHAITKLSHLHFPASQESADRIARMGEDLNRIHVVGAPALDTILNQPLPSRQELFHFLRFDPNKQMILVTQHSSPEQDDQAAGQMTETLEAVKSFNIQTVVIYPNSDAGGRRMIEVINQEKANPLFRIYPNLDYSQFLALEKEAAVWVGNSSAAMIESSSFGVPVVNIGTRQLGRQRGGNVIDTGYDRNEIASALGQSLNNKEYRARIKRLKNPWGDGMTGPRVARILEELTIDSNLLTKQISY